MSMGVLEFQLKKTDELNSHTKIMTQISSFCINRIRYQELLPLFIRNCTQIWTPAQNLKKIDAYLEGINLPKLSEEDSQAIDRPITREEIVETIKGLTNSKSPGSGGYYNEFYKTFVDDISPILEKA